MRDETPTMRLASHLLNEPVLPWIRQRREAGKTWRMIRDDLRVLTGGKVDVPHQTIVSWVERDLEAYQRVTAEAS